MAQLLPPDLPEDPCLASTASTNITNTNTYNNNQTDPSTTTTTTNISTNTVTTTTTNNSDTTDTATTTTTTTTNTATTDAATTTINTTTTTTTTTTTSSNTKDSHEQHQHHLDDDDHHHHHHHQQQQQPEAMTNGLDPDPDLDPDPESSDPTLTLTLDNLPYELLLLVFRYVDAGHLIKSVAQVCSKFRLLLSSETYWKTRLTAWYSPDRYPPVSDVSTDFDWESSCVSTEQCYSLWHNLSHNTEKISAGEVVSHFSDSLHIMQDCQTVVIGSRDHSLTVLNISDIDSHKPASCKDAVVFSDCKQHKGWIWCLHSHGTQLCSGCWDSKIRLWDTDPNISLVSTFKCTSPILDIVMEQNVIVAATHNHKVTTVDVREGHMEYLKLHRMPVLCMAVTDRYFITGSEDCTLCIYDRCAAAVFKKIKLDYYPLCINYSNHHLWVGDHSGHLMLFDASNDQFNLVKSYELGSLQCKLTAIRHSPGAVFTSYNERQKGKVSIMEPTTGLQTIATIEPDFGEIAALDHCNNTLAYVGSNDCLDIYRPKQPL